MISELDLDVILTDLMMPGANDIDVLKYAVETAIEALRMGAQDYLLKPLMFEDVLHKVERLILASQTRLGKSNPATRVVARRCRKLSI